METARSRDEVLKSGLHWLLHTEQPGGAVISPAGLVLRSEGNRRYRFGLTNSNRPVVSVEVAEVIWASSVNATGQQIGNPLERDELSKLGEKVTLLGGTVASTEGGYPSTAGCAVLADEPHAALRSAVLRWRTGCPDHPGKGSLCGCGWLQRGQALAVGAAMDGWLYSR